MSKDLKEIYNKIAPDFYQHWLSNKLWLSNDSIKEFFKVVPKGAKVLDLGCGSGIQSNEMVKRGYQVTGIDFSKEMIKLAQKNVTLAEFRLMDMNDLKFDDEFKEVLLKNGFEVLHQSENPGRTHSWINFLGRKKS